MNNNTSSTNGKINISQTNMKIDQSKVLEKEFNQEELNQTVNTHYGKFDDEDLCNSKELIKDLKTKKKNIDKLLSNNDNTLPFTNEEISLKDYCHFKNFLVEHPKSYGHSNKIIFTHKFFSWRRYSVQLDRIVLLGSCLGENESSYSILKECLNSITHESKEGSFLISEDHKQLNFSLIANLSKNEIKIPISIKFTAELDLETNCLESSLNNLEQTVVKLQEYYYNIKNKQDEIRKNIMKSSQQYSLMYEKTNQK